MRSSKGSLKLHFSNHPDTFVSLPRVFNTISFYSPVCGKLREFHFHDEFAGCVLPSSLVLHHSHGNCAPTRNQSALSLALLHPSSWDSICQYFCRREASSFTQVQNRLEAVTSTSHRCFNRGFKILTVIGDVGRKPLIRLDDMCCLTNFVFPP